MRRVPCLFGRRGGRRFIWGAVQVAAGLLSQRRRIMPRKRQATAPQDEQLQNAEPEVNPPSEWFTPKIFRPAGNRRCEDCKTMCDIADRFCYNCGHSLAQECPHCAYKENKGRLLKFCPQCGGSCLHRKETRRRRKTVSLSSQSKPILAVAFACRKARPQPPGVLAI
jgi:hypothetical protein